MFSINFWKFITIFYFLLNIELQNCSVNIKRVYSDILSYNTNEEIFCTRAKEAVRMI